MGCDRLEGGWLGYAAYRPHKTLLQACFSGGHAALIQIRILLQLHNPFANLFGQRLTFVHHVDFGLRQIAVALDVLMLVVHMSSLQETLNMNVFQSAHFRRRFVGQELLATPGVTGSSLCAALNQSARVL